MNHPPRRTLALAALALAALAACTTDDTRVCPGQQLGALVLDGTRTREALDPGLDPDPGAPDCGADVPYDDALPPFTALLSTDPGAGTAALCPATDRAQFLFGTLAGGRLDVSTTTDGAVLGDPCPATCVAAMTLTVRGTVSGEGAALRFDGAVVERLAVREGADCGGCALPCAARFVANGVPPGAP